MQFDLSSLLSRLSGYVPAIIGAAILTLIPLISFVSAYNAGNRAEQSIVAVYENNEQILAQYGQKVKEAAQVPGMARDDYTKLFKDVMAGRYGDDGSKAVFSMITEQNPTLGPEMYTQIQRIIEAGRDEFKAEQRRLVDEKRSYRTALGSLWGGTWLRIAGYPTIAIGHPRGTADDYPAISTAYAKGAFEKGVEEGPITLRKD